MEKMFPETHLGNLNTVKRGYLRQQGYLRQNEIFFIYIFVDLFIRLILEIIIIIIIIIIIVLSIMDTWFKFLNYYF